MSWINTDYICTCRTGTYNLILNTGFQTISFKKNGACTSTVWYPSFQNKHAIQIFKPLYFSIFFLPRSNVAECEYYKTIIVFQHDTILIWVYKLCKVSYTTFKHNSIQFIYPSRALKDKQEYCTCTMKPKKKKVCLIYM